MQPDEQTIADADARFITWMHLNLDRAAQHFGLTLTGEPVFGWRLRTIGATATGVDGPRWLRVVTEVPEWARGDTWTGNTDANTLTGITKPAGTVATAGSSDVRIVGDRLQRDVRDAVIDEPLAHAVGSRRDRLRLSGQLLLFLAALRRVGEQG